jgi:intergrase/recombinase
MKIIDLDNLSKDQNILINKLAKEIRSDFDNLINKISKDYYDNINWIVSSIASRNKYQSSLFLRCLQLEFVKTQINDSKDRLTIITSDTALSKVLKINFGTDHRIISNETIFLFLWRKLRPFRQYLIACYFLMLRFLGSRGNINKYEFLKDEITLIDTFVLNNKSGDDGSIKNGIYKDRYYPGLLENLSLNERKNIFFIPTIVGFNNPISIFSKIRKSNYPFIVHDDFLKISDYIKALTHPFYVLKFKFYDAYFRDIDIKNLLIEERNRNCSDFINLLGILYYRFSKRLKENGVKVRLLVEWYENQVMDRGMIKGFHEHYPNCPVHGYQGYIISKDLHIYTQPNYSEYIGGAVPDKVFVTGKGLKKNIKEFCKKVKVDVAPGFRFRKVNRERKHFPEKSEFTILIGLPIGLDDCVEILRMFINYSKQNKTINYVIKPHPTWSENKIKSLFNNGELLNFSFVKGDFHDHVEKANLLVSNASSVSLEALTKEVPVIIIAPISGIVQNPIPDDVSNKIWKLVRNMRELNDSIDYFKKKLVNEDIIHFKYVKREYFEPISEISVRNFLKLD